MRSWSKASAAYSKWPSFSRMLSAPAQRLRVLIGRVTLVVGEAVVGVRRVHLDHDPVPGDLGQHAGRRHACRHLVALPHRQPGYAQLASTCPSEIVRGGEDGREVGAFGILGAERGRESLTTALRAYLNVGYQKLLTFERPGGGFDWWGNGPPLIWLSASTWRLASRCRSMLASTTLPSSNSFRPRR